MPAWSAGFSQASVMLCSSKASAGTRTSTGGAGAAASGAVAAAGPGPAAARPRASAHAAVVAITFHRMVLSSPASPLAPVLDDVLPDVVPVDVLSEAGPGRDAHEPLRVDGVDGRPQPGTLRVVVEPRVQQAALVE